MARYNRPLTRLYYSAADNSWYGWWADGTPATIGAIRMQAAYLELCRRYQQQGLDAVTAGRQAQAEVHNMTYWDAQADTSWLLRIRGVWDGRPAPTYRQAWLLLTLPVLWGLLLMAANH